MTNSDSLHIEPTPMGWTVYYDPEGLHGDGATKADALEDLLEQTDEAWRKALDGISDGIKWVSVEERVPEEGVRVYVQTHTGLCRVGRWTGEVWEMCDYPGTPLFTDLQYNVERWVTLPEAPK